MRHRAPQAHANRLHLDFASRQRTPAFRKLPCPAPRWTTTTPALRWTHRPRRYDTLPYTARAGRTAGAPLRPGPLTDSLKQLIERKRDLDSVVSGRVVCHDILGQTALVDLAGLRDAIADQGGDPSWSTRWCRPS